MKYSTVLLNNSVKLSVLFSFVLLLGSCSQRDESPEGATGAGVLSGVVSLDGSSTVFPISEAVAEEFRKVQPDVRVTVGVHGTGAGMKKFIAGWEGYKA